MRKKIATFFVLFLYLFLFSENEMEIIAEIQSEHPGAEFGYWSTALDFNGDGYDDLVVNSRSWDEEGLPVSEGENVGKFYIYFGKEEGFADSVDITFTHIEDGFRLGYYTENLGDMNGDGYEDLCYYTNFFEPFGEAYYDVNILLGNAEPDTVPDYTYTFSLSDGWSLGERPHLSWLGDINGDGYDDVGLILDDMEDYDHSLIIFGGNFELINFKKEHQGNITPFINGAGDPNNDGFNDFIIGHKENDLIVNELYFGGTILDTIPDIILTDYIEHPILNTCGGFYCGDFNGDSIDDFIGNCCSDETQGLGVWFGDNPIPLGPQRMVQFYSSISKRNYDYGDVNGDGKSDIVSGVHYFSGRMYAYLGGQNGTKDLQYNGNVMNFEENFGWSISVGDFNGDGYDDIASGAPALDTPANSAVYVFAGNPDLEEADPDVGITEELIVNSKIEFMAYPNPFNPSITFEFKINNRTNIRKNFELEIYNVKGQKVKTFSINIAKDQLFNSFTWNAEKQASGIYFCKLVDKQKILSTQKVTLLK